jgi:hypothetical protein
VNRVAVALVLLGLEASCSFRGGDFTPLAKEPETPCSRQAEAFCKENLGSADLASCIKRETYRCELLEQQGEQPQR